MGARQMVLSKREQHPDPPPIFSCTHPEPLLLVAVLGARLLDLGGPHPLVLEAVVLHHAAELHAARLMTTTSQHSVSACDNASAFFYET
jgi:hypothetical protein